MPRATRNLIVATSDRRAAQSERDLDVRRLPIDVHVHVHVDALGHQAVIFKGPACHVTLLLGGSLLTLGPARLSITAQGMVNLPDHIARLSALAYVLLAARPLLTDRPGEVDRIKLRDAIIALDGERAGATRRQIATVIHGAERVAADWSHPNGALKAKIKRDVQRGHRLIAGGWRQLLGEGRIEPWPIRLSHAG